jgi:hypothetical protein
MEKVLAFEKPFKSVNVLTNTDEEILVSEGFEIKTETVNELTGEVNKVEGTVLKLEAKKMHLMADNIAYPILVKFSEISKIEVL